MSSACASPLRSLWRSAPASWGSSSSSSGAVMTNSLAVASTSVRHSHIGAAPLYVPKGTSFTVLSGPPHPNPSRPLPEGLKKAQTVIVEGPQGKCIVPLYECVRLQWDSDKKGKGKVKEESSAQTLSPPPQTSGDEPNKLSVSVLDPSDRWQRSKWGLTRALLNNALEGVQEGHTLILRFVGVGYRGTVEDEPFAQEIDLGDGKKGKPKRLNLRLGYSHPVLIPIPEGITCTMPQPNRVVVKGTDKEKVGLFASKIRAWRPPEPYKGKGIFVGDETIKLKAARKK